MKRYIQSILLISLLVAGQAATAMPVYTCAHTGISRLQCCCNEVVVKSADSCCSEISETATSCSDSNSAAPVTTRTMGCCDVETLTNDSTDFLATKMVKENPDIGAVVLECTEFPPYAHAIQQAIRLGVWDFVTMTNFMHALYGQIFARREAY